MCIIQNQPNHDDWLKQSLLMDDIYSHSHINLSAVASASTNSSLFESTLAQFGEGRLTTALDIRRGYDKVQYPISEDPSSLWFVEVEDAPLNRRAWVLQERQLASRTLHFGSSQLFWECREHRAAEAYPDGFPEQMSRQNFKMGLELDACSQIDGSVSKRRHNIWSRLVGQYSKCGLTISSDKLVALSGLAKRVKSICPDEYVAGMWRDCLEHQLFWATEDVSRALFFGNSAPSTRAEPYRAPSFCWVAIDAAISMHEVCCRKDSLEYIQVADVKLTHVAEDTFGSVSGGHLDLRCLLQKIFFPETHSFKRFDVFHMPNRFDFLRVNGKYVLARERKFLIETKVIVPKESDILLDDYPEHFDPRKRNDLYCVPNDPMKSMLGYTVSHLLLQQVDAEQGVFKRFGLASTTFYGEWAKEDVLRLREDWTPEAANYPCISYDAEKKRHLIRII